MLKTGKKKIMLGGLVLSLLFVFSCNEEERHGMLTFFFDGVPPLGGVPDVDVSTGSSDPNAVRDPNSQPRRPLITWYEHEPRQKCETCHGEREKRGFSREVKLVAEVPELCYTCHEQFRQLPDHVHGPVAIGVCTYCHEPHRTRNQFLLKYAVPDLCYQCHDADLIEYFDSKHADESYADCMRCHDAHASEDPALLKEDRQGTVPEQR